MSADQITEKTGLEAALTADLYVLFKHSLICPVSGRAFAEYEAFVEAHPDVPTGWIDVIGQRPWSQWVAAETGVEHQSPQALLIKGGEVVWNDSHLAITKEALEAALVD